jgi:vacuolar-type H+-ATPase subunit F/Vma7
MGGIAALGEAQRVQGLGLAGVLVLPAEQPDEVRAQWSALAADVVLVILTPRARAALGPAPAGPLTVVLPP